MDYLKARVPEGKTALVLNLDETSVPYAFGSRRGNVVPHAAASGKVKRSETRGAVTHVGIITHDPTVQARLPQYIIGNHYKFTLPFMAAANLSKPANVVLVRQKSAWNTLGVMKRVLVSLNEALQHFPHYQPILVMDTASCHTNAKLVRAAGELGIWIAFIPAKLTFLLQPLDTHAFAGYKACLKKLFWEARGKGELTSLAWIKLLFHMCTKFLCGKQWWHAFERTGLTGDRGGALSGDIQSLCGAAHYCISNGALPSKEQMQQVMPAGRSLPYVDLWWKPSGRGRRLVLIWGNARRRASM